MKNKIEISEGLLIDIPKVIEGGMLILANSGGGKSYAIRKFAEEAVNQVQTIILDPEGEFASLRDKYDFILAGKNADAPVEVRSAALLATKLLKLGKSAVIDLYELHPSERQRYVKYFCDSMVNCPKELYHPVFVILDEAHEYVPEGKPSEATWAVEALASKGRKRGFRLIPASQRISKLSKNVSAECNNKLIGRASQDIDMKRAGDELGFNKDRLKELRQLKPGEFFAFGPAISDDIIKIRIAEVKTEHAKVDYKHSNKVPPPSHVIKKVLGELADLPKEAEKEAKTISEYKSQVSQLKRKLVDIEKNSSTNSTDPKAIEKAVNLALRDMQRRIEVKAEKYKKEIGFIFNKIGKIKELIPETYPLLDLSDEKVKNYEIKEREATPVEIKEFKEQNSLPPFNDSIEKPLSKGAKSIFAYLTSAFPQSKSKTQIWVATGYSPGGGFNNLIYELTGKGLIIPNEGKFTIANSNLEAPPFYPSLELWKAKLSLGARKIFELLLQDAERPLNKEILAEQTGYALGGGFNNNIYELTGAELIKKSNGGYIINPEILDL